MTHVPTEDNICRYQHCIARNVLKVVLEKCRLEKTSPEHLEQIFPLNIFREHSEALSSIRFELCHLRRIYLDVYLNIRREIFQYFRFIGHMYILSICMYKFQRKEKKK